MGDSAGRLFEQLTGLAEPIRMGWTLEVFHREGDGSAFSNLTFDDGDKIRHSITAVKTETVLRRGIAWLQKQIEKGVQK